MPAHLRQIVAGLSDPNEDGRGDVRYKSYMRLIKPRHSFPTVFEALFGGISGLPVERRSPLQAEEDVRTGVRSLKPGVNRID